MPLAEEKLADRAPFDVYAVLMILSFLFTLAAILICNADLQTNWARELGDEPGSDPANRKVAWYLTRVNKLSFNDQRARATGWNWVEVNKDDEDDFRLAYKAQNPGKPEMTLAEYLESQKKEKPIPYPAWLNPYDSKKQVKFEADAAAGNLQIENAPKVDPAAPDISERK